METELRDVRLPLMVTRTEAAAIDHWRYSNRIPTRAEAVRRLIEAGLKAGAARAAPAAAPRSAGRRDEERDRSRRAAPAGKPER